jgi:hypothetical protein
MIEGKNIKVGDEFLRKKTGEMPWLCLILGRARSNIGEQCHMK